MLHAGAAGQEDAGPRVPCRVTRCWLRLLQGPLAFGTSDAVVLRAHTPREQRSGPALQVLGDAHVGRARAASPLVCRQGCPWAGFLSSEPTPGKRPWPSPAERGSQPLGRHRHAGPGQQSLLRGRHVRPVCS